MSATISERELVLETLLLITRDGEFSHIALNNILSKYQYLDKKERAFISRMVNGTLEHMIEIDYIINQFSKVKVNKMKPVIRTIIRSAVYQLKYMDSVPDSAACNEAVKLAMKKGFVNLKGFVNGVLRNISRNLETVDYPTDAVENMSVRYSIPSWMLKGWLATYGEKTVEVIAQEFLKEKPISVRFNPNILNKLELISILEKEGVMVQEVQGIDCALYISGFDYLGALQSFGKGLFQIQDISSMLVAKWANPKSGDYVIDVCGAPGGKAIHIAELLCDTGHVEARDLTDYKVGLMQENISRSGLHNIEAVKKDALTQDKDSVGKADIVIADLPCSGMGVLGKKPDLKYKMTEEGTMELAKMQRDILGVVNVYVKPGGKLLYSTCTINRTENEDNTKWFLEKNSQFTLVKEQQQLPGIDGGDGFYIAMFQKEIHE